MRIASTRDGNRSFDAEHDAVVADRLSTLQGCDQILVFDRSRIVESGSYQNLIQQQGLFTSHVAIWCRHNG